MGENAKCALKWPNTAQTQLLWLPLISQPHNATPFMVRESKTLSTKMGDSGGNRIAPVSPLV